MILFVQLMVSYLLSVGIGLPSEVDMGTLKKGDVKITAKFSNTQKGGAGFFAAQGKKHLFMMTASPVAEGEDRLRANQAEGYWKNY
jgi:hypothetical protein